MTDFSSGWCVMSCGFISLAGHFPSFMGCGVSLLDALLFEILFLKIMAAGMTHFVFQTFRICPLAQNE